MTTHTPVFHLRVWGTRDLRRWYPERGLEPEPIGEAWLSPPGCPVLIKLLFPLQPVSVQVHPDDAYAAAHGFGVGKSEAWHVLEAAPGARLGVGLREGVNFEDFAACCRAGQAAAELLNWLPVSPGDTVNIPAGTVHAIGAGVVLFEVQQPSDTTFRLDDFGRGRPLHLEHGLAVARSTPAGRVPARGDLLLETPHFRLYRHDLTAGATLPAAHEPRWLVNVGGSIKRPSLAHLGEIGPGVAFQADAAGTVLEVRAGAGS